MKQLTNFIINLVLINLVLKYRIRMLELFKIVKQFYKHISLILGALLGRKRYYKNHN